MELDRLEKIYGIEWVLLEKIVIDELEKQRVEEYLVKNHINWGKLLHFALRQKVAPTLAYYIIKNELIKYIPDYMRSYIRLIYDYNKRKTNLCRFEADRISKFLRENQIDFVSTKGIILESLLYGGEGYRNLSDIDFIIKPKDKEKVLNVLKVLGYTAGKYDYKEDCVMPYTREQYLRYVMTGNKLPNHFLTFEDNIVPYLAVGFDMSLTWTSFPYNVDIERCFKNTVLYKVPNSTYVLNSFDETYHFLYIILHLVKHAWSEYLNSTENDCNLSQFSDVIKYYRLYKDEIKSKFKETIEQEGVVEPVCWVLEHADRTFNTNMISELLLEEQVSESWLQTTICKTGIKRKINGTMRDKLFYGSQKRS